MILRFADPIFLSLLLLLPFTWYLGARLRAVPPLRRGIVIAIRTTLLILLILALARMELAFRSRDLAVFFVLDRSDSIPAPQMETQTRYLQDLTGDGGPRDYIGVIAFGGDPSIETTPVNRYEFEGRLLSRIDGTRTDIGSALRLAIAAFPADKMRRIVLMSDGNENSGSALDVARHARNSGIPIDTIPIEYDIRNDVRIDRITLPQNIAEDAPFDLRVHMHAEEDTRGQLRLYHNGELVLQDEVDIRGGRTPPLVIPRRLTEGGFHTFEAVVDVPGDVRPQNNRAQGFTWVEGEPRILIVEGGNINSIAELVTALRAERIAVDVGPPETLPLNLEEVQRYDAIVLSNVSAGMMSQAQMRMLERGVHDLGVGLVMIGGENSFGAGGYTDTPVEMALPVTMDLREKRVLPNGALVLILHTCEIPQGNAWAREICLAALNVLSADDYFGLLYYGSPAGQGMGNWTSWGEHWLWSPAIQKVEDKRRMRSLIRGVQPLDMPTFDPTLRMAAEELEKTNAQTKHIVIISDGDPAPPSMQLLGRIRGEGITISTVVIAPHTPYDVRSMEELAYRGGGNFYYPQIPTELPRIFTKEATVVRQSLIREETFTPILDMPSDILQGIGGFPPLEGYVLTSIKDLATQALVTEWDDPLMAHWRYGLGKSIAFTSDAKTRWAPNWVSWEGYSQFWAQAIRWVMREGQSPNFQVATEITGGTGTVAISATDDAGNFRNFLDFDAVVIGPDFEARPLDIHQVGPGRYEATFPANEVGSYMVSMTADDRESPASEFITTGVSLSYSPEYETNRSNRPFLERLSESSGGQLVTDPANYNPFERTMLPARRPQPVWPWLLFFAALLLPVDVFVRRVYINWGDAWGWISRKLGFGRVKVEAPLSRMDHLRAAKERAMEDRKGDSEAVAAREAFRARLEGRAGDDSGSSILDKSPNEITKSVEGPKKPKDQPTSATDSEGISSLLEAKKRATKRKRNK
ncbi:MAG: VWA domain-containing protein [Candidatus Sumerlaeia bacterium]|nr:VWA domain-containing protein [Candidatus Sumerlaeia bacterium]